MSSEILRHCFKLDDKPPGIGIGVNLFKIRMEQG